MEETPPFATGPGPLPPPSMPPHQAPSMPPHQAPGNGWPAESKRVTAGIFALLLGGLGIHKFYLGYTKEGVLQILLTVFTCGAGSVLALAEGVVYLTKSDAEFVATYQVGRKGWL